MNKIAIGLLCLIIDAALIAGALFAMRNEDGHIANPAGIAALILGALFGFAGLYLLITGLRRR